MGQSGHGKQLQLVPIQGEAEQTGTVHLYGEVLGGILTQLQHDVNSLQPEGIGLALCQVDEITVYTEVLQSGPELPQHGLHAGFADVKPRTPEFTLHQGMELLFPDAAQLAKDLQDVFLLNRQKHAYHLPVGALMRLSSGSTIRSLSLSAMQLKMVAIV